MESQYQRQSPPKSSENFYPHRASGLLRFAVPIPSESQGFAVVLGDFYSRAPRGRHASRLPNIARSPTRSPIDKLTEPSTPTDVALVKHLRIPISAEFSARPTFPAPRGMFPAVCGDLDSKD